MARKSRSLGVALQGGGAHGAFTWGVLDRVLEEGRYDIQAITGTSAGAVNAVAVAHGLLSGGPDGARETLATVWTELGKKGPSSALISGSDHDPSYSLLARMGQVMTSSMSPQQLNPLKLDPVGDVLSQHIDFERIRSHKSPLQLGIAATDTRNGRLRIFTRDELTVQMVLASACLPRLTSAVQIDDRSYWDGGYAANPPLLPLVEAGPDDALLVLIVPSEFDGTPTSATEIDGRETEFRFLSGFLRETQLLAEATELARTSTWPFVGRLEKQLRRMRWHLIDGGVVTGELNPENRGLAHAPFLESLRDAGRNHAEEWLAKCGKRVGRSATADLATLSQVKR